MQGVGNSPPPPEGNRGLAEAERSQKMNNNSTDRNESQNLNERDFSLASTEETTSAIHEQELVFFEVKNANQNTPMDKIGQRRNISRSNTLEEIPPSTKGQHQSFSADFETREDASNHNNNRTIPTVRPVYLPPTSDENILVKELEKTTSTSTTTGKTFLFPRIQKFDRRSTPTTTAATTTSTISTTISTTTTRQPQHQPLVLLNNSNTVRSYFPEIVLIGLIYKMVYF